MALHRALTPPSGDPSFDRVVVLVEPLGEPCPMHTYWWRALQPRIELRGCRWRRVRKVLGKVDGLGQFGLLGAQVRELRASASVRSSPSETSQSLGVGSRVGTAVRLRPAGGAANELSGARPWA